MGTKKSGETFGDIYKMGFKVFLATNGKEYSGRMCSVSVCLFFRELGLFSWRWMSIEKTLF